MQNLKFKWLRLDWTHNHLVHKRTLNHSAKLAKWLSCVVSTYLYGHLTVCSCHVTYALHSESLNEVWSNTVFVHEYLLANNCLHKVNNGNANTRHKICSNPIIKTSEQHLWGNFFKFKLLQKQNKKAKCCNVHGALYILKCLLKDQPTSYNDRVSRQKLYPTLKANIHYFLSTKIIKFLLR